MEWRLAEVIDMPFGVDCSSSNGEVELARLIVYPVSAAMVWFIEVAFFS